MTNAKMIVSPERWKGMDEDERTWLIYETLMSVEQRVTKLEHNYMHKTLSFVGGIIGGAAIFLGFRWGGIR